MKEKTKILFIMHMPPPVHGAAIVGQNIHDSKLINETFECSYINPSASTNVAEVGKLSLKKFFFLIRLIIKVCATICKEKPDICYYTPISDGFGIYRDAFTIRCMKLVGAKKIILHLHNKGVSSFSNKPFSKIAYKTIFKGNKVILLAKELKEDVENFVKDDQIVYCPNGMPETISESRLEKVLLKRVSVKEKAKILYLSNMMTEKGIYVLLEACKLLKEQGCSFECNYVGNWGDTTYEIFDGKIREYGLKDYVNVHGPKYGIEKMPYLEDSNIFVFPTFYHGEAFSLVLLEAMEYAIPCISTFEGGIPSIITDNWNGLLVHQKNAVELCEKIKYLTQNPNIALSIGQHGREHYMSSLTLNAFEHRLCDILTTYLNE